MHALGPKVYDGMSCPSVEQASRCKTISQVVFVSRLAHGKVGVCYTNEFPSNSVMFPVKYWSPHHARSPESYASSLAWEDSSWGLSLTL